MGSATDAAAAAEGEPTMTTAKARREEIYHLAVTTGLASVEELSRHFRVTASTIRRDLAQLNEQGKLARTYGGAVALGAHPEPSLRQRTGEAFEQKQAIAAWAASEVKEGENILLDGGSTVGDSPGVQVDCLGGRLRSVSQTFVGPLAEAALERMSFDRVFLGADAVTVEDGLCEADQAQTRLKELMARRGNTVYVLADSTKLGKRPFHAWVQLPAPWILVTDDQADPEQVQLFRNAGVTVQLVDAIPARAAAS
jgi:DeoR/GlpR family transcriptional regulator of sugar metabolism